jgi:glycosyltransferase involved in cell wall biosynthesis
MALATGKGTFAASPDYPLVSIVVPSYNQARFLEHTLLSILQQDYPRLECIVVDGGSTDGSQEIIRRHADRLAHWVSQPDLGQADAINKGFNLAGGDIFAWLNSDDTYNPGALREAVEYLRVHPEIGMVYGNAYYIDADGRRIGRYPARRTDYRGLRRGVNNVTQQSMFFRSAVWHMVGPLDPSFYYAMDYDLWVRIAAVTPIAFQDRYWANFRLHRESKSMLAASRAWPEIVRVHFRDGGSRFSILYAKYLLRRLLEPLMPLRMKLRLWRYRRERHAITASDGPP